YGRRSKSPLLVSRGEGPFVSPDEGGDEPVALARRLPGVVVAVAARRADAARLAEPLSCDVFLLDDGFQHPGLKAAANLLRPRAREPFGGGRLPPAGRLREPLEAIRRADAIVFTRVDRGLPSPEAERTVALLCPETTVFHAAIRADGLRDEAG